VIDLANKLKDSDDDFLPNVTLKPVVIHVLSKLHNKIALLRKERESTADAESDVIYIASTGGCVILPNEKQSILYHAVVIPLKPTELEPNFEIFPVTAMLTSKQDVSTINEWLTEFKNTISASKWPLFKGIFTDFSWANFIAIRKAWNNMSVVKYLDQVYERVSSDNKINV
jgi:hypothetical protein